MFFKFEKIQVKSEFAVSKVQRIEFHVAADRERSLLSLTGNERFAPPSIRPSDAALNEVPNRRRRDFGD